MLSIYLFCLTFMFYCWLYTPQESQEGQSNSLGDAMGPSTNRSREVDSEALEESQSTASNSGWDVIEQDTSWHGWSCPLPMTTPYWGTDELQTKTIRQLKKLASEARVAKYGTMSKQQLIHSLTT